MQTKAIQVRFNEERVVLGLPPKEIEDKDDMIQYALDFATPGPLSMKSKATLEELKEAAVYADMASMFTLGDEDLADLDGIEELSDEDEALLMREMDVAEAALTTGDKTGKSVKEAITA
ncbi:hypothetical protein G7046_g5530 [Stylonectria norvegica]|nr:hypothetical protein G7046_g5530 [Stylonectria norvegica]